MLLAATRLVAAPWWDDFPRVVETGDVPLAVRVHANAVQCGSADDPCWGLYGQELRLAGFGQRIAQLKAAGLHPLTWIEAFGTCEAYVAQVKPAPGGGWVKERARPDLTSVFAQFWSWHVFDGSGEIRWVGIANYFDDEPFARPYTRTHPRYGCPPLTWPDGRPAVGAEVPADPRTAAVFAAACSQGLDRKVSFEYGYNAAVNRLDHATGQPTGPLTGLLATDEKPAGPPDPGFTPQEWAALKHQPYAGQISAGKDSACPIWIDYARASVRRACDAGIEGLWVDNWSPWDSFGAHPATRSFGEWSVAGFKQWVTEHPIVGATYQAGFDVRDYLNGRCRAWGGRPENLHDPVWRDPRWRDDPIWRAWLVYKRQTGTAALSRLYRAIKQTAAECGQPDFLVSGNDIPIYALGWPRGDLDVVSTELSWGWGLTTGPRGLMPPPLGSYVPVYKLAREHARGRFVNAWMYVPDNQLGKRGLADVLYYQALANHAMPWPHHPGRTAGTEAGDADFYGFVAQAAPLLGARQPVAEVGLYLSSSSQLLELLPGGFGNHAEQPHSFSLYGWGTALTQLHEQWRAVPEWKLDRANLDGLKLLIVGSAEVFPADDVATLEAWVRAGGCLLVAGACGGRLGEAELLAPAPAGTGLGRLTAGATPGEALPLGQGRVLWLTDDLGLAFYRARDDRLQRLPQLAAALHAAWPGPRLLAAEDVPPTVGLTVYREGARWLVDENNTAVDLATDVVTPAAPCRWTLAVPGLQRARLLAPGPLAAGLELRAQPGSTQVAMPAVPLYAAVVLEP